MPGPKSREATKEAKIKQHEHSQQEKQQASLSAMSDEERELDESFFMEFDSGSISNITQYERNLKNGLRVKDLRGILGLPPQYLPSADPRIDGPLNNAGDLDSFGRVYSEKIIKYMPLLLITPGSPTFLSNYSIGKKKSVLSAILGVKSNTFDSLLDGGGGKFYSLKYAYVDYFSYVNTMMRSAAVFLGIGDEVVDGQKLNTANWLYKTGASGSSSVYSHGSLRKFLGPYSGALALYADCGTETNDSFSNSTTQSGIASSINTLSDKGREANFLIGNVGSNVGLKLDKWTGQENLQENLQNVEDMLSGIGMGKNNIFSSIIQKAETVLAGGRLTFPEIWASSSFSRSYSCRMKLVAPAGDKLSIYLHILSTVYHLLGLVLPRQAVGQSYFSPFLVRAYYKSLFNVDMGIIDNLSVTKGGEGEWTIDGLPTVAEISFSIQDLYQDLFMTADLDFRGGIMSNISELDYIANTCGVNVNDQEVMRTIKLYSSLALGTVKDTITNKMFGKVGQYFNQKLNDIFGVF